LTPVGTGTLSAQPTSNSTLVTEGGGVLYPDTDYLDFSSYNVAAVYLDNDHKYAADHSTLAGAALAIDATADGSSTLSSITGGGTYIVLKQLYADDTIYEISWWKDQASTGTGHGTPAINGANADASQGIIGTVDFGKELDTAWFATADMVLL
jgi:hypothetical protein